MLPIRVRLRHLEMNINRDYPSCNKVEKNVDHIFRTCDLALMFGALFRLLSKSY